ncbi:PilN domain-containing protein [Thalassolituus hydrocarboniclasticus]|uniref:PilN domain-containing protein n=1 Tax=Thalassolituus hydrocarboniclasticus TaxID=2742796 RepID=A0ABY6A5E2_9GAMM|nr:PilN domain-containing protein [Thalassolituus hydrocarboniclasticus]UXD86242.1 PilN domain-containing protein [Thalassolituus hydrocarboniclasticus]
MANINLLPWRQALRKEKQNEFYGVIALVALCAAAIIYLVNDYYQSSIQSQNRRNAYITNETRVLEEKISEIRELKDKRKQLIERMELIQALQGNRPIIVRVFDEVARSIPEDLYFDSLSIKGTAVTIKGVAKSNNRVAALMRNFDQSEWFADPALIRVQAKSEGVNEFEVTMKRVQPKAEEE